MTTLTEKRPIADTGILVSPIGLGTVKFGRNTGVKYPAEFDLPDDKHLLDLLAQAWDYGINLLDTAPAYGHSEQRLGELLPKLGKEWVIATKVGETFDASSGQSHYQFDAKHIRFSVEQSLKKLKRDVLDIVLIHSDGRDREIIEQEGALAVLDDLKQQGLIRATGMSTKTVNGGLLALAQSDIAMVMHNLHYHDESVVLDYALEHGKAIFIKKALGSGHMAGGDMQQNFDVIYQHKAVTSVILGTITPSHLGDNVAYASHALQQ